MIGPLGSKPVTARPAGAPEYRLPAVRNGQDKTNIIIRHAWFLRAEELAITRDSLHGREFTVPDDTIIVSELPHSLQTIGVTCCLAIAVVDVNRLVGALVHTYIAEQYEEPLQFALNALNSEPGNLRFGLSGMLCTFGGKENEIRAGIAAGLGRFGQVIYNQLGKKGDIALNFQDRTIKYPYDLTAWVRF